MGAQDSKLHLYSFWSPDRKKMKSIP